jgi:hypothetical protein
MIKHFEDKEEAVPSLDDILSLGQNEEEAYKAFSVTIFSHLYVVAKPTKSSSTSLRSVK